MKNFFKNKPRAWFIVGSIITTILVLVSMFVFLVPKKGTNVLASINDQDITQEELNELVYGINFEGSIQNPEQVSQEKRNELFLQLLKWKAANLEAKERGISINEDELKEEYLTRIGENVYNNYQKAFTQEQILITDKIVRNEALIKKIEKSVLNWYEGDLIIARFDKYGDLPTQEYENLSEAEWQKIKEKKYLEDKGYAESKINEIYQKIKSEEITPEQAIEISIKDKRIGKEYFSPWTPALSRSFTKDDYLKYDGILADQKIRTAISEQQDRIGSPIMMEAVKSETKNDETEIAYDAYYVIINIKNKNNGQANNINDWLEDVLKNKYNTKIYAEEFKNLLNNNNSDGLIKKAEAHLVGGTYVHAGGWDYFGTHYGVKTGSSSSTAGLIAYTQYFDSAGNGPYPIDGVSITVSENNSGDHVYYAPAGSTVSRVSSRAFTTGSEIYRSGGNSSAINHSGYLVLGYGSSPAASYAHWGNGYSLGCSGNPFTISVANPSGRTGKWDSSSVNINVTNGYTTGPINFTWRDNRPPTPTVENPGNKTIAIGQSSVGVAFRGYSTDPDGDKGKVQIMYKKTTDTQWTNFGINNGAEDPSGSYSARSNGIASPNINDWGWSWNSVPAPTDGWVNNATWIYYPAVNLTAGTYEVAVRGVDSKNRYSAIWDKKTFTVSSSSVTLTMTVSPVGSGSTTPAVGSHPYSLNSVVAIEATPATGYTFSRWESCSTSTSQNASITMDSNKNCTAIFTASTSTKSLSCSVTPQTGLSPLVVNVTASATGLNNNSFDYRFVKEGGSEETITGRGTLVYYTLQSAGNYNIFVRNSDFNSNNWVPCNPATLTVTDPTDDGGGEVVP